MLTGNVAAPPTATAARWEPTQNIPAPDQTFQKLEFDPVDVPHDVAYKMLSRCDYAAATDSRCGP